MADPKIQMLGRVPLFATCPAKSMELIAQLSDEVVGMVHVTIGDLQPRRIGPRRRGRLAGTNVGEHRRGIPGPRPVGNFAAEQQPRAALDARLDLRVDMVARLNALHRAEPGILVARIAHLKAEDWVLYPRLLASPDGQISSTAREFCEEMGGLAAAYIEYCEQWNADAITADWAGYCKDSRELIDALTIRITRENRELYPLLDPLLEEVAA